MLLFAKTVFDKSLPHVILSYEVIMKNIKLLSALLCTAMIADAKASKKPETNTKKPETNTEKTGKAKKSKTEEKVLAKVKGEIITEMDILIPILMSGTTPTEEYKSKMLDESITSTLINQLHGKKLMEDAPELKQQVKALSKQIKQGLILQYYSKQYQDKLTDDDLEQLYSQYRETETPPMMYTATAYKVPSRQDGMDIVKEANKSNIQDTVKKFSSKGKKVTTIQIQDEYGNDKVSLQSISNVPTEVRAALSKYNTTGRELIHNTVITSTDKQGSTQYWVVYIKTVEKGTKDDFPAYDDQVKQIMKNYAFKKYIEQLKDQHKRDIHIVSDED